MVSASAERHARSSGGHFSIPAYSFLQTANWRGHTKERLDGGEPATYTQFAGTYLLTIEKRRVKWRLMGVMDNGVGSLEVPEGGG